MPTRRKSARAAARLTTLLGDEVAELLRAAFRQEGEQRTARIAELTGQVSSGRYRITSEDLAQRIMETDLGPRLSRREEGGPEES